MQQHHRLPITAVPDAQRHLANIDAAAALAVVDDLVAAGNLSGAHLLPSVRGELLSRLGKLDDARHEIELAVRFCGNERERSLLQRKLAALA